MTDLEKAILESYKQHLEDYNLLSGHNRDKYKEKSNKTSSKNKSNRGMVEEMSFGDDFSMVSSNKKDYKGHKGL